MPKIKGSPSGLKQTLAKANVKPKGALWEGPESEGPNGGVTQSLLSRFLCCRERFRVYAIEGLRPRDEWNHRTGYGDMWHLCEEVHADPESFKGHKYAGPGWEKELLKYTQNLLSRYPMQQEAIKHWYSVCMVQFPIYVDYWAKHPDMIARTPLLQEQPFNVPYGLPSGRVVRLRGKFDSVDLVKKGKEYQIFLQENKSKGDVDETALRRQLSFDLQVMTYLVALNEYDLAAIIELKGVPRPSLNTGVRYNVIRRPLSGGKGTIVRHKPSKKNPKGESEEEYYNRLKGIIEGEPQHYFMRWMVEVTPADIERFKKEFLNPELENLCDWYFWVTNAKDPWCPDTSFERIDKVTKERRIVNHSLHSRLPYGIYNVIADGGFSDVDAYLNSGDKTGLKRTDVLFKEL